MRYGHAANLMALVVRSVCITVNGAEVRLITGSDPAPVRGEQRLVIFDHCVAGFKPLTQAFMDPIDLGAERRFLI